MKNVVAYIRVSTEEQSTLGVSLQAQECAIKSYCDMRSLNLVECVVDAGVSAGKALSTRVGGQRVLDLIKQKQVQGVVAFKLDRLFRNSQDCLQTTSNWDKGSIALHLLDMGGQSVDTSSAMGRFFITIMSAMAEMERGLIRERTKMAMKHKASKNQRVGQLPYGKNLSLDTVHLENNQDEQKIMLSVFELNKAGLSTRKIAHKLNEQGVKSRGSRWHHTTIQRIIKKAA